MAKKKCKKKKKSSFYKVLSFIFCVLSFIFAFLIFSIDVLPNRYMLIVMMGLLVFDFIIFLLLKYTNFKLIKLFTIIISLCLSYGIYSLINTSDILTSMNKKYKISTYCVVVKEESSYKGIKDLKYKKVGYFQDNKDILKNLRIRFESKQYSDVNSMVEELLESEVDAIILEKSYVDMLSEDNSSFSNFEDDTKVIYSFDVSTKINEIVRDVDTTKKAFTIYISGIDTYGSIETSSRTDANMLIVINPNTNQILLVSIPRDYYVDLYGKEGKDKLTHSGIYGIDTSVKTLENLIDTEINYYYKINFTSLINIVDALGGVDVYSKYSFVSKDGYSYKKGYNHVNGKEALSFARERKSFAEGDKVRNINQQALVEAIFRKSTDKSILVKYNSLLNSLKDSFMTNMPSNRLTSLIKKQLDKNDKWSITSYGLDGVSSREYTYSYKSSTLYVMKPNYDSVSKAKELIEQVYKGNKLESSYYNNVSNVQDVTKVTTNNKNIIKNNVNTLKYNVIYVIDDKEYKYVVDKDSILDNVNIPTKDGYKTIGWFYNDSLYDFNTKVNSDITLVARYEKIESVNEDIEEKNINE